MTTLTRRTPMRSRTPYAPRPARQWTCDMPPGPRTPQQVVALAPREIMQIPKTQYVRSPALLKACREIPCQACGTSDGTVVAAHSNQSAHGKCRGIKASDEFIAAMCFRCHSDLDQGPFMSAQGRVAMWNAAHNKTVRELVNRGLWPKGVEVPA